VFKVKFFNQILLSEPKVQGSRFKVFTRSDLEL
jgi:hypothetical protein